MAEVQDVRRLGYAINDEENRAGLFSAGAVVRDSSGRAIAVLSGAVPSGGLGSRDRARIIELVRTAARNASRKLGAPNADASPGTARSGASSDAADIRRFPDLRQRELLQPTACRGCTVARADQVIT
jgi:hypothetical protein